MSLTAFVPRDVWDALKLVQLVVGFFLITILLYLVQNEFVRWNSRIKNLPGPRGWPVVGNLFQVRNLDLALDARQHQKGPQSRPGREV